MATNQARISISKEDAEIVKVEHAAPADASVWVQQYPLLREKTEEELAARLEVLADHHSYAAYEVRYDLSVLNNDY
jgi:hypothetical protein